MFCLNFQLSLPCMLFFFHSFTIKIPKTAPLSINVGDDLCLEELMGTAC